MRESVCSCEVKMEPNLSQALHLLNGDTVQSKIQEGALIERRLAEGRSPSEVIDELYVRCLCRKPTEKEMQELTEMVAQENDKNRILQDMFWALINSREFLFNH